MHRVTSLDVSLRPSICIIGLTSVWVDGIELMFVGIGFITVPLVIFLYTRINRQREKLLAEGGGKHSPEEIRK